MLQDEIKEIRDVLREVKYPGTSKNIVELDMVQHVRIEGNKVMFRLVFQRSDDPFVGAITKKCRSSLRGLLPKEAPKVGTASLMKNGPQMETARQM